MVNRSVSLKFFMATKSMFQKPGDWKPLRCGRDCPFWVYTQPTPYSPLQTGTARTLPLPTGTPVASSGSGREVNRFGEPGIGLPEFALPDPGIGTPGT